MKLYDSDVRVLKKLNRSNKKGYFMDICYGTKILNLKTQEIGLLIKTWQNKFSDGDIDFATCVDKNGKLYNIELDSIKSLEDYDDSQK